MNMHRPISPAARTLGAALGVFFLLATPASAQVSAEQVFDRASPAVVTITAKIQSGISQGSGFIVEENGRVVTNYHVVAGARSISVELTSGDVYTRVEVLAIDRRRDIAILGIPAFDLPTVPLGNSGSVDIGAPVIAIGSPLGLENTVSTGTISGRRKLDGYYLLQITAPISPGSSGGPIFNTNGKVIGIAVAALQEGQNLNFAVPINYARGLLVRANTRSARTQLLGKPSGQTGAGSLREKSGEARREPTDPRVQRVIEKRWVSAKDPRGVYDLTTVHRPPIDGALDGTFVVFFDGTGYRMFGYRAYFPPDSSTDDSDLTPVNTPLLLTESGAVAAHIDIAWEGGFVSDEMFVLLPEPAKNAYKAGSILIFSPENASLSDPTGTYHVTGASKQINWKGVAAIVMAPGFTTDPQYTEDLALLYLSVVSERGKRRTKVILFGVKPDGSFKVRREDLWGKSGWVDGTLRAGRLKIRIVRKVLELETIDETLWEVMKLRGARQ